MQQLCPKIFCAFLVFLVISTSGYCQLSTWSSFSSTGFTARYGTSATLINGKIYLIGGEGADHNFLNDIQTYDPSSDRWTSIDAKGGFTLHFAHSTVASGGKLYVFGGVDDYMNGLVDSVWVFDPVTTSWSVLPNEGAHFTDRYDLATSVIGDSIFAIGGAIAPGWWVNTVEIFDTKSRSWSTPAFATDSFQIVLSPKACVIDGKIYVVGHPLDTSCHCEIQVYNPKLNSWTVPATSGMRTAREYFCADEFDGKIYVTGGGDFYHGNLPLATTEVYDPVLQTWSLLPTVGLFTGRDYFASAAIGNKIYTFGGQIQKILPTTEVLTLNTSGVLAGDENKSLSSPRIFPNPAANILHLDASNDVTEYQISDELGRSVLSGRAGEQTPLAIDVSSLPAGGYVLLVTGKNGLAQVAGKFQVLH